MTVPSPHGIATCLPAGVPAETSDRDFPRRPTPDYSPLYISVVQVYTEKAAITRRYTMAKRKTAAAEAIQPLPAETATPAAETMTGRSGNRAARRTADRPLPRPAGAETDQPRSRQGQPEAPPAPQPPLQPDADPLRRGAPRRRPQETDRRRLDRAARGGDLDASAPPEGKGRRGAESTLAHRPRGRAPFPRPRQRHPCRPRPAPRRPGTRLRRQR